MNPIQFGTVRLSELQQAIETSQGQGIKVKDAYGRSVLVTNPKYKNEGWLKRTYHSLNATDYSYWESIPTEDTIVQVVGLAPDPKDPRGPDAKKPFAFVSVNYINIGNGALGIQYAEPTAGGDYEFPHLDIVG